jgi:hypothetical protein
MDLTTLLREIALTVSDGDLLAHEVRATHEDDDDSYEITGMKLRYNVDGKPVLVLELGLVDE